MKATTLLLLGALGFGIYEIEQLKTFSNNFQLIFQGVDLLGVLKYRLNFIVQNVTNATVTINSFAADVTINDNDLGNVSTFTPTTINPNSQQQFSVILQPSLLSLPGTVLSFINNPPSALAFKVIGSMNVDTLVLPVECEKDVNFS